MFFKALGIFLLLLLRQSLISSTQSILISQGKPAAQSYTFLTYVAGLAVDGDTVNTCSLTVAENIPQWWYVDLGGFYNVDVVYLYTSTGINLDGVEVHVANYVSSTRDSNNKCGFIFTTGITNQYFTHCIPSINGRYVYVSRSDTMPLLLCEVKVYAAPSSPCDSSPCLNGGFCNDFSTSYNCSCPTFYTGLNCQTFEDTIEPVVTCPADINVNTELSEVVMTWDDPVVTDDVFTGLLAVCSAPSGSTFPVGSTNVTCSATDGSNTGYCVFTVLVIETGGPIVTCPNTINMDTDTSEATVTWDDPSVTDNIDTDLSAVCSPSSGSLFSVGSTVVTCNVTDNAGNDGSCTFTVSVIEDKRDDMSSIPSYLIVVLVIVCVALLVMTSAFIFYCRSYYSLKNRMQNATGMNLTDYDEVNVKTTTNIHATEYEVNLPNVDGTAPPKLELKEEANSGYEDLHTYMPVEPAYTDIKQ